MLIRVLMLMNHGLHRHISGKKEKLRNFIFRFLLALPTFSKTDTLLRWQQTSKTRRLILVIDAFCDYLVCMYVQFFRSYLLAAYCGTGAHWNVVFVCIQFRASLLNWSSAALVCAMIQYCCISTSVLLLWSPVDWTSFSRFLDALILVHIEINKGKDRCYSPPPALLFDLTKHCQCTESIGSLTGLTRAKHYTASSQSEKLSPISLPVTTESFQSLSYA